MNKVLVISPEKSIYEGIFKSIHLCLTDGLITILPGHAPFLGELKPGPVLIIPGEGDKIELKAKSGFVVIFKDRTEISLVEEEVGVAAPE